MWLAAHRVPGFLEFFVIHEHVARYLTPSAHREEPWWFFVPVLLLGSLPWTLPALRGSAVAGAAVRPGFDAPLFLRLWVLFALVFFSVSDSKLIPYILPALPALALLVAGLPEETLERDVARTALMTVGLAIVLGIALFVRALAHRAVRAQRLLPGAYQAARRGRGAPRGVRACTCSRSAGAASRAQWCS